MVRLEQFHEKLETLRAYGVRLHKTERSNMFVMPGHVMVVCIGMTMMMSPATTFLTCFIGFNCKPGLNIEGLGPGVEQTHGEEALCRGFVAIGRPQTRSRIQFPQTANDRKQHLFAFAANRGTPVGDTRRHLRRIVVSAHGPLVRIRFEGDGFLYKMVRMLVAAMVRVAQGKGTLPELRARLAGRGAAPPRQVAPADGLYLVSVRYGKAPQSG